MFLPRVILLAGKKKSGKDFIADQLVEQAGYTKLHIAEHWLRRLCREMGIDYDTEYLPNKALYREEIQRRASIARERDPLVLVRELDRNLSSYRGQKLAISGIRFINEAAWGMERGFTVVKVWVPDEVRRQRFIEAGENLNLFDDPFESEIDELPWHLQVRGDEPAEAYLSLLSGGFVGLINAARQLQRGERILREAA